MGSSLNLNEKKFKPNLKNQKLNYLEPQHKKVNRIIY